MTAGRHVTSLTTDWNTPAEYVQVVRDFFGGWIALDPCSNGYALVGAKVEYKLPEHDGLRKTWDFPTIYVNPPYGRNTNGTSIKDWLLRCSNAYEQHESEIIALIPVATNTAPLAGQRVSKSKEYLLLAGAPAEVPACWQGRREGSTHVLLLRVLGTKSALLRGIFHSFREGAGREPVNLN